MPARLTSEGLHFIVFADATPRKRGRPKKIVCLDDRYLALSHTVVAPEEEKSASEALHKEMQNTKPRRDAFLPLVKTTFALRHHYILHDAESVNDILQDYAALKEASAVSSTQIPGVHTNDFPLPQTCM